MGTRSFALTALSLCATALLVAGCGTATPVATEPAPEVITPDLASAPLIAAPEREGDPAPREAAIQGLNGKWFGKLISFDPVEPALNSWNIDFELTQTGYEVNGVVIISELIPIALNIWDVYIRLDATTHGTWDAGTAHLHMFQDVKGGDIPIGPVIMPGVPNAREMEYVEAVITGVVDNTLQGYLVIHWRNPYDRNASWTQTCQLSNVTPVAQGSGGGGD